MHIALEKPDPSQLTPRINSSTDHEVELELSWAHSSMSTYCLINYSAHNLRSLGFKPGEPSKEGVMPTCSGSNSCPLNLHRLTHAQRGLGRFTV